MTSENRAYDIGDRRKLSVVVCDEYGVPTDPGTLTFSLREPDGAVTNYIYGAHSALVRTAPGTFHVLWDCTKAGIHRWRYAAGGNIGVAEQATFAVKPLNV